MSGILTADIVLGIHASHQPGSDPRLKFTAAANVQAALTAATRSTATRGLTLGVNATAALAAAVTNATAGSALSSTSAFMADVRASITAGASVTDTLATGGGVMLPSLDVSAAATALLDAEGEISVHPSLAVRAHLPVLQGLATLAVAANESGAQWGVGVALPFASDMALAGSVTGDLAGAREAWITLAWAHRREVTQ